MNNFVVEVWKKFGLDTDLVCYAKIFLQNRDAQLLNETLKIFLW